MAATLLLFIVLAMAGLVLSFLAGYAVVRLRSAYWPVLLLALASVALALVFFSFASAALDRFLDTRPGLAGAVHWFAISTLGLAFAAVLGIPTVALGPRGLAYVLAEDVGLALAAGLLMAVTGPLTGFAIHHSLRTVHSERADSWGPPPEWRRRFGALLVRCLALALIGLFLGVGEQAVASVGNPQTGDIQNVYAPIGGWVLGSAIAWRLTTRLFTHPSHHVSRHPVHGSALSLLFSILAVFLFAHTAASSAMTQSWSLRGAHGLAQPVEIRIPTANSRSSYDKLAAIFSPELRFEQHEHWYPTSVRWFVHNAKPYRDSKTCLRVCYELPCDDSSGACAVSGSADPTIYVRVAHGRARWPDTEIPHALRHGWVLIQYWFFYNYDSLRMPVITQWHQGDWEQVTVALSVTGATASPVSVAYSEHCAGTVLPWSRVEIGRGSTHPLVFVARGSHANYPRPVNVSVRQLNCSLGLTPPRYLGVGDLVYSSALHGADVEVPVDYVFGIRDRTGTEPRPRFRLQPLAQGDEVEGFGGFWGRDNKIAVWPGGPRPAGDGPNSPPNQGSWISPGQGMLCSNRWFGPRSRPACDVFLPPLAKQ